MEMVCRIDTPGSVSAVAREDLHDLVLPRELELLQPFLLDLFFRGEIVLLLQGAELPLQVVVLLVVAAQLRLALEQGGDQFLVLRFHTRPSAVTQTLNRNTGGDGVSTPGGTSEAPPGPPNQRRLCLSGRIAREFRLRRPHVQRLHRADVDRLAGRQAARAQARDHAATRMMALEGADDQPRT